MSRPEPTPWAGLVLENQYWPQANPWFGLLLKGRLDGTKIDLYKNYNVIKKTLANKAYTSLKTNS